MAGLGDLGTNPLLLRQSVRHHENLRVGYRPDPASSVRQGHQGKHPRQSSLTSCLSPRHSTSEGLLGSSSLLSTLFPTASSQGLLSVPPHETAKSSKPCLLPVMLTPEQMAGTPGCAQGSSLLGRRKSWVFPLNPVSITPSPSGSSLCCLFSSALLGPRRKLG
jgi:hypothetical protein